MTSRSPSGGVRTLFLHGSLAFGATTAVNALNFVFHVAGSRWLGPIDYGTVAALLNLLALASIPATVIQLLVAKLVAELHALGDEERVRAVFERLERFGNWAAVLILALGALAVYPLAAGLHVAQPLAVVWTICVVSLGPALAGLRGILQGEQRFAAFGASLVIEAVGKSILGVGLIAAHLGVAGALGGYLVGTIASRVYTGLAVRGGLPAARLPLLLDVRRLWQSTQGIAVMQACIILLSFSDIVVAKHFFDAVEAGIYSAVALTGKILLFLVGFVPLLVLPRAAARSAQGRSALDVIGFAGAFLALAAGVVLGIFAAAPESIVRLTSGSAYLSAAPFIVNYGIAMTLLSATQIVATYNAGRHRFGFVVPLAVVTVGEIVGLVAGPHQTGAIVRVVEIGNACALGATGIPYFSERIFSRFASIAGH